MTTDGQGNLHQPGGSPYGGRFATQQRAYGDDLPAGSAMRFQHGVGQRWTDRESGITVDATMIDVDGEKLPEDFFTRYAEALEAIRDSGYRGRLLMSQGYWPDGTRQLMAETGWDDGNQRFLIYFDADTGEVSAPYASPRPGLTWQEQFAVQMEDAVRTDAFRRGIRQRFGYALSITGSSARFTISVASPNPTEMVEAASVALRADRRFEYSNPHSAHEKAVWTWMAQAMKVEHPESSAAHREARRILREVLDETERDPKVMKLRKNRRA